MPKVSFILPAYKRRFLKEAIDSILAQTCRDFELVIVDDKSPEGLYEVIKEYPWEPEFEALSDGGRRWLVDGVSVRYYQNDENIGGKELVAAWNKAMEYATGEWCVLASDDDRYLPGFLSEMMRLVDKYPQCDLAHCRVAGINEQGEWTSIGEQRVEFETQIQQVYARGVDRVFQRMPDFMFRRAAWKAAGGFVAFPLAWYSDDATWMVLAKNGVACSKEILFEFRSSDINLSSRFDCIEQKHMAEDLFRQWFREFCKTLRASNKEEEFLLKDLQAKVGEQIDALSMWELDNVRNVRSWFRLLRNMPLSRRDKLRVICRRYPRIGHLWHLLVK